MYEADTPELARTAALLHDRFGDGTSEPYVAGKTHFRDVVCDAFGISELEGELLCDSLEQAHVLVYSTLPDGNEGWTIDPGAL